MAMKLNAAKAANPLPSSPLPPPLLLDMDGVKHTTKLSRSLIYQLQSCGKFPAPLKIGRSARWSRQAIEKWVAELIASPPSV